VDINMFKLYRLYFYVNIYRYMYIIDYYLLFHYNINIDIHIIETIYIEINYDISITF